MWSLDHGAESDPASTLDESLPHSQRRALGAPARPRSRAPTQKGTTERSPTSTPPSTSPPAKDSRHPMTVALPDGEDGVYSAIGYAFDAPSDERTVHVDRFGGEVVSTYGYDDYPLLAKVVSQGIGWHEGRSLGLVSFWAAAAMCALHCFLRHRATDVVATASPWRRAGSTARTDADRGVAVAAGGADRPRRPPTLLRRHPARRAPARPARRTSCPVPRQVVQRSVARPREAVPAMRRAANAVCGSGTVTVTVRPLTRWRRRAGPVRTVQTVRPGVHQKP